MLPLAFSPYASDGYKAINAPTIVCLMPPKIINCHPAGIVFQRTLVTLTGKLSAAGCVNDMRFAPVIIPQIQHDMALGKEQIAGVAAANSRQLALTAQIFDVVEQGHGRSLLNDIARIFTTTTPA